MSLEFVNNLFVLSPRPFGDMGEEIIKLIIPSLKERKDHTHDASEHDKRIEIKCSRARIPRKVNSLVNLLTENYSLKSASLDDLCSNNKINCIFEHIKTRYFDKLYYSIFTSDCVLVFGITPEELVQDKNISFCNKQTRDAQGDGQFHIRKSNVQHHMDNYLIKKITYDKIEKMILENYSETK